MLHNCKTLEQVVDSLYCQYRANERRSKNLTLFTDFNRSVVIVNTKTGKHAIAKCDKNDVYDFKTGVAIAWAKYNHINPRWKEKTAIANLKTEDMFSIEEYVLNTCKGFVTYIIQDVVDGYVYCRSNNEVNGPSSKYKRFSKHLIVQTERTLY